MPFDVNTNSANKWLEYYLLIHWGTTKFTLKICTQVLGCDCHDCDYRPLQLYSYSVSTFLHKKVLVLTCFSGMETYIRVI